MDYKKFLKNKSICTLPWSGFELEPNGKVKNCVISKHRLGNINNTNIKDIINGETNVRLKESMLEDDMPANCSGCYLQENDRNNLSSISSRLYYHKELGTKIPMEHYNDARNFSLKHVDLRWTNACNQACVYCSPELSSKWGQELGEKVKSKVYARQQVKEYVFDNITELENVYLAGGEPILMKENYEFLKVLKEKNPMCSIRVNTNLSSTRTGVFELLCKFENVHWIVSVESMRKEYEYIRHHGVWDDFLGNLNKINQLDHKISFNMLFFILNYHSIYDTVKFFRDMGYHENSFIIGPLYTPIHLNVLNLPDRVISQIKHRLQKEIAGTGHYLRNSYENILAYINGTDWKKDTLSFVREMETLDQRRGLQSKRLFAKVFEDITNV